jgi:predicted AlkP superfamily phosphohydrolase/phosphomutase
VIPRLANKIVLLGLDGATWRKLDEYVEKGLMPNFSSIIKNGSKSILNSTIPFTSNTAWTSIFTGTNPGKHGIPHHSIKLKKQLPSIFEILSNKGIKSIVINDVITYPPFEINGIMVCGGIFTPTHSENFVYPPEIRKEMDSVNGPYIPSLDRNVLKLAHKGNLEEFLEEVEKYGNRVLKTTLHLAKKYPWDVFATVIEEADYIHHYCWDKPDFLEKFYTQLDKKIQEYYNLAENNNANFIIVSDHGFGPLKKYFLVNSWLNKAGFTQLQKPGKIRKTLSDKNLERSNVRKTLSRFRMRNIASKITPQKIKNLIPVEKGEEGFIEKDTTVFSEEYNEITINSDKIENYEELRDNIIKKLLELEDNGEKIVLKALKREDVYHGPFVNRADDIQLLLNEGYGWSPLIRDEFLIERNDLGKAWTGDHRPEGIFFMSGPDIKSNYLLKNEIFGWDIFPTILHLLEQHIPNYVDGKVIEEIFDEESNIGKRKVTFENISEENQIKQNESNESYSEEEEAEIRKHLKDLGYI